MRAEKIAVEGWEEAYRLSDPDGFVALHRIVEGRAFGGTRIKTYDTDALALDDARRLSAAMTLKCAINRLPGGGAKTVLRAESITDRRTALEAYGDFVQSLGGRFYTGPDLGFGAEDLAVVSGRTAHVTHRDLSPAAAAGVYWSMRGAAEVVLGNRSLSGLRVAIQGLGAVGWKVAELLVWDGARVTVQDVNEAVVGRARAALGLEAVATEREILALEADIFAPCAVGQIVRRDNVGWLGARIVCGGANNQLAEKDLDSALDARGIVFIPDFVASSGATVEGVLTVVQGEGDHTERVMALRGITAEIVARARREGATPTAVAIAMAHAD